MGHQGGTETVGCLWSAGESGTGCYKCSESCCPGNSLSFKHDHGAAGGKDRRGDALRSFWSGWPHVKGEQRVPGSNCFSR